MKETKAKITHGEFRKLIEKDKLKYCELVKVLDYEIFLAYNERYKHLGISEVKTQAFDEAIAYVNKLPDVAAELQKLFLHEMATIKIDTEYRVGYVDGLQCALNKLTELSK